MIGSRTTRYGRAALDAEAGELRSTPVGNRANRAFQAAMKMGSLIAGGELSEEDATQSLLAAAERAGLGRSEAFRHVANGIKVGKRSPRRRQPRAPVQSSDADLEARLDVLLEIACAQDWPRRRSAPTSLAIIGGLAKLARDRGNATFPASMRQVAEASGVTVGTISKHVKAGNLRRFVRANIPRGARFTGASTRWSLSIALPEVTEQLDMDVFEVGDSLSDKIRLYLPDPQSPLDPTDDRWGVRGRSGWLVALAYQAGAHTPDQINARVPVSQRTAAQWLKRLSRLDLDGPVRRIRIGQMAEQHSNQRDLWAEWLATSQQRRPPCWLEPGPQLT